MNFLELVQKAWREAGQSGDGPASVDGVTGHQLRFVSWVRDAWLDIQQECDEWVFLKSDILFDTISAQESYGKSAVGLATMRAPLAAFRLVDNQFVPIGLKVATESAHELCRVNKGAGAPGIMYYDNGAISFDAVPDGIYTVKLYYLRAAQELSANSDIPIVDPIYHRAIVWRAVKSYARFDQDEALFAGAKDNLETAMMKMYSDLSPRVTFGRSAF